MTSEKVTGWGTKRQTVRIFSLYYLDCGKRMMCLRQLRKRNQKRGRNRYNMKMRKINEEWLCYVFLYFLNNYVWAKVLMQAWCTPFSKTAVIRRKTHLERCSGSQAKKSWSSSCFKNFWIEKVCKYTYHIKIYNKLLFCYEKPWVLLQAASKACVVKQFCPIPV